MVSWTGILSEELHLFLQSERRQEMLAGERYYQGKHDILGRKKTVVGPGGRLEECKHLKNSRVVDNQYAPMTVCFMGAAAVVCMETAVAPVEQV